MLITLLATLISINLEAADRYAVANGNWTNTATWSTTSGGAPGATIPAANDNIYVQGGFTVTVNTNIASLHLLSIASGSNLVVNANSMVSATTITVNGIYNNESKGAITTTNMTFGPSSIYIHNQSGGTVPTATWNISSTCILTRWDIANDNPTVGLGQFFGNFSINNNNVIDYNSSNYDDHDDDDDDHDYDDDYDYNFCNKNSGYLGVSMTIQGNFTVNSTRMRPIGLQYKNDTDLNLTIGGNLIIENGIFFIEEDYGGIANGGSSINVNGNFIQNGGEFNLNGARGSTTLNVKGDFSQAGGKITETGTGSGSIIFNGTTPQIFTSGGSVSCNINYIVNGGAILQMADESTAVKGDCFTLSSGGYLGIKSKHGITNSAAGTGVYAGNIRTTTRTFSNAANYIYNGSSEQNAGNGLPTTITGSVKIDNAAGVTLCQNTNISTGTLYLTSGLFTISLNTLTMGTDPITVHGRISRSGGTISAIPAGNDVYTLEYTGNDINTGNEFNAYSKNLILNLNNGKTVNMKKDFSTSGEITFTSGYLNPSTFTLAISSGGSVKGANHGSFVNGKIFKTGTTAFTFPVGAYDATHGYRYHPIEISGLASITTFSAQYYRVNPITVFNAPPTGVLTDLSKNEYWDLSRTDGTSSVDVTLYWNEYSGAVQNQYILNTGLASVVLAHYKSTNGKTYNWHKEGAANTPHTIANTVVSGSYAISGSVKVMGVSTFSPMTPGSTNAPLPVALTSFTAKPTSTNTVALNWATSSEIVNKGFRIERQADGVNGKFESIGFVASKAVGGNSQNLLYYNFIDANPRGGATTYYRLAQENFDGKTNFSDVRVVKLSNETVSMVFPNPSNGVVNISRTATEKKMNVQVIDMAGRLVQHYTNVTDSNFKLNITKSGIYNIKMTYPETGEQSVQRIVIEK